MAESPAASSARRRSRWMSSGKAEISSLFSKRFCKYDGDEESILALERFLP